MLEVVEPVLVKGVGFRIGGLGLVVVLLFIIFRPLGRPLLTAAASDWLLLRLEVSAEVAEVVGRALGDLCAAAALIIIRRVSSALLGWW